MHAVVGIWTLDESLRDEQLRSLREEIVPRTRQAPGFVCGYWMHDPETGKAHSVVMFISAPAARHFKTALSGRFQAVARLGITSDILRTVDVVASAAGPCSFSRSSPPASRR